MSARVYGGIPLTLMLTITVLQCGAGAGWWPVVMPQADMLGAVCAWGLGFLLLWQIDAPRQPPVPRVIQAHPPTAVVNASGVERRTTPRFALRCPVELDLHELGKRQGELQDISQGGARIAGVRTLDRESHGLLRIPGITLAVPFVVVSEATHPETRVRFELPSLGMETFIRQLERLVAPHGDAAFTTP